MNEHVLDPQRHRCVWCCLLTDSPGFENGCRAPLTAEAKAIGERLETRPPRGMGDRYSALGWAHVAQAVLDAKAWTDGATVA